MQVASLFSQPNALNEIYFYFGLVMYIEIVFALTSEV